MTVTIEIDGEEWAYEGDFPCEVIEATMRAAGILKKGEVMMTATEEQADAHNDCEACNYGFE